VLWRWKKSEWWDTGMVICLERDADLHMAQLMPLPLTVSCFSKIHIGFTFLVPAHPGSPGQRAVKQVCVLKVQMSSLCSLKPTWLVSCNWPEMPVLCVCDIMISELLVDCAMQVYRQRHKDSVRRNANKQRRPQRKSWPLLYWLLLTNIDLYVPLNSASSALTLLVVHIYTRLTAHCTGLPRWAGTRKVKLI